MDRNDAIKSAASSPAEDRDRWYVEDFTRRLLLQEEARSEAIANYWRLGISVLFAAVTVGVSGEVPGFSVWVLGVGSFIYFLFSVFMFFHLRAGKYSPALKYVSVFFDISMTSVCMGAFGSYRTFKTEAFLLYYVWIALATMRLSERLTLFAGALSLSFYAVLVALALLRGSIGTGTISESFVSPDVSLANQILRILFMGIVVISVTYGARAYRRLARSVHEKELLIERERMRAEQEEAVARRDRKFRRVVETTSDGYCFVNPDQEIVEVNSALCDMFGYHSDELIGRPVYEFLDEENRAKYFNATHGLDSPRQRHYEVSVTHKDGRRVPVLVSATTLFSDEGGAVGSFGFVRDISGLKSIERELGDSLRKKEVLMREMHHRTKNNLSLLQSLLTLQSRHVPDAASQAAFRESSSRISAIGKIHELLYKTDDVKGLDVRGYLKNLVRMVSENFQAARGRIGTHAHVGPERLDVEEIIAIGLMTNELLINALKYAFPEGRDGNIRVSLEEEGGRMVLSVRDDGVGLPKGFDLRSQGTFGMQIVAALVEQLKGDVRVLQTGGTEFRISFPKCEGRDQGLSQN